MAEYLSPGVYVEEFNSGIKPMVGTDTSTAGFIGMTQRGKVTGAPEFVGSYGEFQQKFGGYLPQETYQERRYLPLAVEQFFANGGTRCYIVRLLDENKAATAAKTAAGFRFAASSPGKWGNDVTVAVSASPTSKELCNFQVSCLDAKGQPVQQEDFQDVSLDAASDHYICKVFEKSLLVTVRCETIAEQAQAPDPDTSLQDVSFLIRSFSKTNEANTPTIRLENGCDHEEETKLSASVNAALLKGNDGGPGKRSGVAAFRDVPDVSILVAPGVTDQDEIAAIITHCELMQNRVCILDMPSDENSVTALQQYRAQVDSSYAAMYHPWIQVFDPLEKKPIFMPPSGAVAGMYARTDNTRGVHKAPANEIVKNCTGLQVLFGKPEQDLLNPAGINLIRNIQGQGIRIWGARTCSNDPNWKYINVRRLCIYIEESIRRNISWAASEPNDALLWTKLSGNITAFLSTTWHNGALAGSSEGEAFFVNVGKGSTMTDDDILNGRLICVIGIAPVRPAEFVIFRITQIMATSPQQEAGIDDTLMQLDPCNGGDEASGLLYDKAGMRQEELDTGSHEPGTPDDRRIFGFMLATVLLCDTDQDQGTLKLHLLGDEEQAPTLDNVKVIAPFTGKDCGASSLPEAGEKVVVGFFEGCFDRPFVLGRLHETGGSMPQQNSQEENVLKSFKTKAGTLVEFSDAQDDETVIIKTPQKLAVEMREKTQSILITAGEAQILIDGKSGAVSISGQNQVLLESGKARLALKAGGEIEMNGSKIDVKGSAVKVESSGTLDFKGQKSGVAGAMVEVKADGVLTLKGSMTKIN